jgi:hypothetical protein
VADDTFRCCCCCFVLFEAGRADWERCLLLESGIDVNEGRFLTFMCLLAAGDGVFLGPVSFSTRRERRLPLVWAALLM